MKIINIFRIIFASAVIVALQVDAAPKRIRQEASAAVAQPSVVEIEAAVDKVTDGVRQDLENATNQAAEHITAATVTKNYVIMAGLEGKMAPAVVKAIVDDQEAFIAEIKQDLMQLADNAVAMVDDATQQASYASQFVTGAQKLGAQVWNPHTEHEKNIARAIIAQLEAQKAHATNPTMIKKLDEQIAEQKVITGDKMSTRQLLLIGAVAAAAAVAGVYLGSSYFAAPVAQLPQVSIPIEPITPTIEPTIEPTTEQPQKLEEPTIEQQPEEQQERLSLENVRLRNEKREADRLVELHERAKEYESFAKEAEERGDMKTAELNTKRAKREKLRAEHAEQVRLDRIRFEEEFSAKVRQALLIEEERVEAIRNFLAAETVERLKQEKVAAELAEVARLEELAQEEIRLAEYARLAEERAPEDNLESEEILKKLEQERIVKLQERLRKLERLPSVRRELAEKQERKNALKKLMKQEEAEKLEWDRLLQEETDRAEQKAVAQGKRWGREEEKKFKDERIRLFYDRLENLNHFVRGLDTPIKPGY